jgi:hypothetical protein
VLANMHTFEDLISSAVPLTHVLIDLDLVDPQRVFNLFRGSESEHTLTKAHRCKPIILGLEPKDAPPSSPKNRSNPSAMFDGMLCKPLTADALEKWLPIKQTNTSRAKLEVLLVEDSNLTKQVNMKLLTVSLKP